MSDSPSSENDQVPGDPVVEPNDASGDESIADVVSRAQAGIADAEAARDAEPAPSSIPVEGERIFEASASTITPAAAPVPTSAPAHERSDEERFADDRAAADRAADAADAERAREEASAEPVAEQAPVADPVEIPAVAYPAPAAPAADDPELAQARAHAAAMADDDDTPWYDRPEVNDATSVIPESVRAAESDAATTAYATEAPTAADTAIVPPAAPEVAEAPTVIAPVAPAAQQPIFVQAPEPPRKRGNRGFAGGIALLASIILAAGVLGAKLLMAGLEKGFDTVFQGQAITDFLIAEATSWTFWTPIVVFFLMFWLLGAFVNTAKWGHWVVWSLLVGLITYAGVGLGAVLQANPMLVSPNEAVTLARDAMLSVPGVVALVLARELPIWFGGWIARRGRRVVALNAEAQEEYERTLEAGPQLAQQ